MTYVRSLGGTGLEQNLIKLAGQSAARQLPRNPVVLIVADNMDIATPLESVCGFLDVMVEWLPSEDDLSVALAQYRPMAVIAEIDCRGQDGYHVMKTVAHHDKHLPILLLTGPNDALAGAADAVEELWELLNVLKCPTLPTVATLVDFLFRAGRSGRCTRFLPV